MSEKSVRNIDSQFYFFNYNDKCYVLNVFECITIS